ncbi:MULTISPECIES: hypothetical protein [unclassified Mycobacterium]|uniref:hypothetical protein n=1 Tax=unclassified Mycobacterium TaxID=2642494 RepID=UPI00073FE578|nr:MULTISPECIES: hypothetical protein [unclassified Mycobacterium]KUH80522.1 hypothetical protein AU186_13345 [Mycobacterium sp. GA-1999]KUH89212.1 hypothetical protein AU185_23665 [Mycobacterium sp. GA-0227b]KUH95947.1 hypothetical protein AU187_20400 [Mycobacterium sp. IS-1556]
MDPMTRSERGLWLTDTPHRDDLAAFAERAMRLDDAAVIRLRQRPGRLVVAWVATGFDVLASRVVSGEVNPPDLTAGADTLAAGLRAMDRSGYVEPGFALDSAWHGALPPESGFVHLDDVPARVMLDLAERGGALAKQHSSNHGPPVSLLDQEVVAVSSGADSVGIPMRCVFALTAMGFLPQAGSAVSAEEIVRVRVLPTWLRIDARFGSVYRRRGDPAVVLR